MTMEKIKALSNQTQNKAGLYKSAREKPLWLILILLALLLSASIYWISTLTRKPSGQSAEKPIALTSLPKPEALGTPPPFVERENLLLEIRDRTLADFAIPFDDQRCYLLHKLRSFPALTECSDVSAEMLAEDPRRWRGKAVRVKGVLESVWEETLPAGNQSGLTRAHRGVLREENGGRKVFFDSIQNPWCDPWETGDEAVLQGYFFKNCLDKKLQLTTPAIIVEKLLFPEMPEFSDEGEVALLADIDDAFSPSEPGKAGKRGRDFDKLRGDLLFYLLHKSRHLGKDALEKASDKTCDLGGLWRSAGNYRGKPVLLKGRVLRQFAAQPLKHGNRSGLSHVWTGQIVAPYQGQDLLLTLYFVERPAFIHNVNVEFCGYFAQKMAYRNQNDNQSTITAIFVGMGPGKYSELK